MRSTSFKQKSKEAVVQRCSVKKVLEISQNSQETTCTFPEPATLLRKSLWRRCFLVNFVKFLRAPFLIERLWWLLLNQNKEKKYFLRNCFIPNTLLYCFIKTRIIKFWCAWSKILDQRHPHTEAATERCSLKISARLITCKLYYLISFT